MLSEGQCFVRVECQESSGESRPEAMAKKDADTTAFPLWIIKHGLWFFWQEASGSRKRKAAVAPEGAEADALADDDEVARPHMIFVGAGFM